MYRFSACSKAILKGTHRVAYIRDKIREDMTEAGYKWKC